MFAKSTLVVCALSLFVQCISSQYLGNTFCGMAAADAMAYSAPASAGFSGAPFNSPCSAYAGPGPWSNAAPLVAPPLTPCNIAPYAAAPYASAPLAASFSAPYSAPYAAEYPSYSAAVVPSSNGGGLATSSASPMIPSGVSMLSENVMEGPLAVGGQLPFLGTVALEGALPTAGAGAVTYGCGNGNVAILAEEAGAAGYNGMAGGFGYGGLGVGYNAGYAPAYGAGYGGGYGVAGCGCGGIY